MDFVLRRQIYHTKQGQFWVQLYINGYILMFLSFSPKVFIVIERCVSFHQVKPL